MKTSLRHQGFPENTLDELAKSHPRVSLRPDGDFVFEKAEYPQQFLKWREEYKRFNAKVKVHV